MTELAAGEFYGHVAEKAWSDGAVFSHLSHDRGRRLPPHAHNAAFFGLLLRGGYRERFGRSEIDYRPLTLVFHSPHLLHEDEIAPGGASFFTMEFDPAAWTELGFGFPDAPFGSEHPDLLGLTLSLFHQQQTGTLGAMDIENAGIELLADALTLRFTNERGHPQWLKTVVDRIDSDPAAAITVNALAGDAGVHPVHLARVFRGRYGISIAHYVRRKRVSAAIRELQRPELTISEIAQAAGFCDHAHFCRVFRSSTGLTPGEARHLLLAS